jgi:predicted translin family RNA/ssDNA-binding protein
MDASNPYASLGDYMTIEEYTKKKEKITSLEKEVTRAEGSLETLMATLKKDYSVSTLEEAATLLEKQGKDIQELEEEISGKLSKLDSLTDWSKI